MKSVSFRSVNLLAICVVVMIQARQMEWASAQAPPAVPTQTAGPGRPSGPPGAQPEYPPFDQIVKDYEKVAPPQDTQRSLYTLWVRKKDGQMLAELPPQFEQQKLFFALTISSGERYAGLQFGEMYVYWKRYDKRLALIEPNVGTRSSGDQESQSSVKRLFTDRVILDIPILTMSAQGGPVIDMDDLLVGQASRFFGARFANINRNLVSITKAKAFEQNLELAFEVPVTGGGSRFFFFGGDSGARLQTLHYSISLIPDNTGYKPRVADERVGYFVTAYDDLGKFKEREVRVRNINRWHLEKADSNLKLSPPKNPIVFYIEHTTPIRYRRWVRQGVLYWNKAFEKVGLSNAIEVYYQDAQTKAHMEKDPEDVRWNFVRWLSNNLGTAIGPSRVHPLTGQILDADIILTDGWIRHYWRQFYEVLPQLASEGFTPETLAWLAKHPQWDPRVRLAPPAQRDSIIAKLLRGGTQPFGGHPATRVDPRLIGDDEFDGLIGRHSQCNGLCTAADFKALDVMLMRMSFDLIDEGEFAQAAEPSKADDKKKEEAKKKKDEKKQEKKEDKKEEKKKDDKDLIDGVPESFIGPLLAELTAHEVGHTLGLRHNFKASSIYTLADINDDKTKGRIPFAGSVMDYLPVNINMNDGKVQGDWAMIDIGPYDQWAIEYGYTFEDTKPILARVAEPELLYATDEDTGGPDPLARRYDFSKNPLDYAKSQMRLAQHHRARLIDKFVKEGESWAKARLGYEMTLMVHTRCLSMMAGWLGGAFVNRDKKGDKNARVPVEVVPAQMQRDALTFIIDNTFRDEAFGLNPELLRRMTVDKWLDSDDFLLSFSDEPTWPVHDRIMDIQASVLTMVMNPTTMRRVYDNEFRVPADQDMLTLPELLEKLTAAIWTELNTNVDKKFTARRPMISSLRRNLQREHMERLIDLTMPGAGFTAAYKPISNLAIQELRKIREKIDAVQKTGAKTIDPYTLAHFVEARERIGKALDAQYIYNANQMGGGYLPYLLLFQNGARSELKPQP